MLQLRVTATFGQGLGPLATGVDQIERIETAAGPALVALSAAGGGLVTLSFASNGQAVVADTQYLSGSMWAQSDGQLSLISTATGTFAAVGREGSDRLVGYDITGTTVGPAGALQGAGLSASEGMIYQSGTSGHLFAAASDGTLRGFGLTDGQNVRAGQITQDQGSTFHATPAAVSTLKLSDREFLVVACQEDLGVSVFEIDQATGDLSHTGALGTDRGLGLFPTIVDMESAQVGDTGYALVVTRADNSDSAALTVIAIDAEGRPHVTDHVLDNLMTRFGAASELEVVQADGWTYVLASGGDSGISLFALSPSGRLVHLDTVASSFSASLDSVSGMAAAIAQDGDLQVVLSRHTEVGFSQLEVDLSGQGIVQDGAGTVSGTAGADLLTGSDGADTLTGGAGNDILEDGAGQDILRGGAGADRFVLTADGDRDVIEGFEWTQDWIDLSGWSFLYSASQLDIATHSWGAEIRYRGETLELRSATGGNLTEAQVQARIDLTLDRPLLQLTEANEDLRGTNGRDTLTGGGGNDTIDGRDDNDLLEGRAGNDMIVAGGGDDTVYAGTGNDTVQGGNGRDVIWLGDGQDQFQDNVSTGSAHSDTVYGGAGDDVLSSQGGGDELHGEDGNDFLTGGGENDTIYGGINFDTIHSGAGDDRVWGGDGRDSVTLGTGNDLFYDNGQGGENGRDTVHAGDGDDTIEGGNGADEFAGGAGNDVINARKGNDLVFAGWNADVVSAGEGNDTVYGGNGRDLIYLNQGNDVFQDNGQMGTAAQDTVFAGYGNDTIAGGGGADEFHGQWGDDVIFGGAEDDRIFGGDGADTIYAGTGADMAWGGNGRDLVYLGEGNDLFRDNAQGGEAGRDTVYAGNGNDTIEGGYGADSLFGQAGRDVVWGGLGNDSLYAGDGDDTVYAGEGEDLVFGGLGRDEIWLGVGDDWFYDTDQTGAAGQDRITGGAGADTFVFGAVLGNDTISDFTIGEDQLQLAIGLAEGRSAAEFVARSILTADGLRFDLRDGQSLLLEGVTSRADLADDILFF